MSVMSAQRGTEGTTEREGKEKMGDANQGDPGGRGQQLTACVSRGGISPSTWLPDVPLNKPAETSVASTHPSKFHPTLL